MRKVVLIMTMSMDGYVEGPDGLAVGNTTEAAELKQWKLNRIRQAGTHIMGRVTYEQMASVWPTSSDPYAAPMNAIPKVVFSRSLKSAEWAGTTIADGDLAEEIAALRRQPGGEIVAWGGARFAQSLVRAQLVDEYALIIRPLAYGGGKPLFHDLPRSLEFDVAASTVFADGKLLRLMTAADA